MDLHADRLFADARAEKITELELTADGGVALAEWFARVHSDDRPLVSAQLSAFRSGSPNARLQYRFLLPSGEQRDLEVSASLLTDEGGEPKSVLGMVMDVTDRQRAMQERERLVENLGERVKELRLLYDAARLLQQARGLDEPLLSELAQRIPSAWLHAEDASARITYRDIVVTAPGWSETPWHQAADFRTSGGTGRIEVCYRREHACHEEGPFLLEERALLDSLAGMLRTYAEHWEAERQRQRLEAQLRQAQRLDALGTLAGGIAHDFNNILTAIRGHAELVLHAEGTTGDVAESIQEILRAHARARDLVRRILLFSRQQESARWEGVALTGVVEEAVALLRASLPADIQIHLHAQEGLPMVLADGTQMHQVAMNLGVNAGYAMKDRGGSLSFTLDSVTVEDDTPELAPRLDPGLWLRLAVRDTGTGMSPEVMDRLFEPFFTTKGQAGTGLGLSVVHGIVQDHGGAIFVSSETGVGTEFRIYLPAQGEAHA